MKSLQIELSDFEYNQLNLSSNKLSFSELLDILTKRISGHMLEESVKLAEKYGLAKMTMDEINQDIKQHRNAKAGY